MFEAERARPYPARVPTVRETVTTPVVTIQGVDEVAVELGLDPHRLVVLGGESDDRDPERSGEGVHRIEDRRQDGEEDDDEGESEQERAGDPAEPDPSPRRAGRRTRSGSLRTASRTVNHSTTRPAHDIEDRQPLAVRARVGDRRRPRAGWRRRRPPGSLKLITMIQNSGKEASRHQHTRNPADVMRSGKRLTQRRRSAHQRDPL